MMRFTGWPEDWIDKDGSLLADEKTVKYYVHRNFALPEDWSDDDEPMIMRWVRCIQCGRVETLYLKETNETEWDFLYNGDNTYTSISKPQCNDECSSSYYYDWDKLRQERFQIIEEDYQKFLYGIPPVEPIIFESVIEELYWKAWLTTFPHIPLIRQHRIGNYRVDFANFLTKTIIELDGKEYHSSPHQKAYDIKRQRRIERQGWQFLRFSGTQIYCSMDKCILETLLYLAREHSELIAYAHRQWNSSPSARVLMRIQRGSPYLPFTTA